MAEKKETKRNIEDIRNIGIIAHIDAGKTTVTERMLFVSGAKHHAGKVDHGNTTTDDNKEEEERGITIYSACVALKWNGIDINLIDTPGHVDFTAEVERSLRVLDGAVVVFSAREGVEAQSETVWRQANRYHVPRFAFINKLDREGASFERVLAQMKSRLAEANPIVTQIPVGLGPAHTADPFRGIIDLVEMKYLTFPGGPDSRDMSTEEIPEELQDEAELWRSAMLEQLYDISNEMMELALQEEPIPQELVRKTLRQATIHMDLQPVLCGSALHGLGVQSVLDAVKYYLPSPTEVPAIKGEVPGKAKKDEEPVLEQRPAKNSEPFCGLVFKVLPAKTGDMAWVRVYSGEIKANSRVLNPGKDKKENVAQIWRIHASKRGSQLDSVGAGDIVGLIGPRHSITGDTLCDPKHPILLESIEFPETVISMAIEPDSAAERDKLAEVLDMLRRQDPTFRAAESEETGQTIISGMGELHLEIIKNRLLDEFNLKVKVHKPRVSYRETIASSVEVVGECHRQIAGQNLFAKVRVRLEPMENAPQNVVVLTKCPPDELLPEYLEASLEELRNCGAGGGLIGGFPLTKLKATVLGGEYNSENSSDVAFRIAAHDAFEKGLQAGGKVLLEPIMKVDVVTPEEYIGDFVGDLMQRRATIAKTEHQGEVTVIEAHAPLSELFGFSGDMRSLSHGRAGSSMEPLEYRPAPPELAETFAM